MPVYDAQRNRLINLRDGSGNLLARGWYTGGGSYELVYQHSRPYLFGQNVGGPTTAYLASVAAQAITFATLPNTMAIPMVGFALTGAGVVGSQLYLTWTFGLSHFIQEATITEQGLVGGQLYTESGDNLAVNLVGVIDHNGTPHVIDGRGEVFSIAFTGATFEATEVASNVVNFSVGATARVGDNLYVVGNSDQLHVSRLNSDLSLTALTLSGDTDATMAIEAAVGIGPDIYLFELVTRNIWRVQVTGDAAVSALLTTQTPNIRIHAALTA